MPTAPLYNGPTVSKAAMPGPMLNPGSVTPDAFGAGIARGIGAMSNVAKDIWAEEQQKANDVAITGAISKAYDAKTQHMYGQKTEDREAGIMLLEGEDLFRNANGKQKAFQDELSGIQNSLATPQLRAAFQRQTMGMHNEFGQSLAIRIAGERKKTLEKTYDIAMNSITNSAMNDAALGVNLPPVSVSETEANVRATLQKKYASSNTPLVAGQLDDEVQQQMFKITSGQLAGMADRNMSATVKSWLDDRSLDPHINPVARASAEKWLYNANKHSEVISAGESIDAELDKASETLKASGGKDAMLSESDRVRLADELIKSRYKGDAGRGADVFHNWLYQNQMRVSARNAAYAQTTERIEARIARDAQIGKGNYSSWRYDTLEKLTSDPLFGNLPVAMQQGLKRSWVQTHESFKPSEDYVHTANMIEWKKIERAPLAVKRAFLALNVAQVDSDGESLFAPSKSLDQKDSQPEHVVFNYLFGNDEPRLRNAKIVQLASLGQADKKALMSLQESMGKHLDAMDSGWGKALDAAVKDVAAVNLLRMGTKKQDLDKAASLHTEDLINYFSANLKPGEIPKREEVQRISSMLLVPSIERDRWVVNKTFKAGATIPQEDLKKILIPIKNIPAQSVKMITENWKKLNKGAAPSTEQIQNEYANQVYETQQKSSSSNLLPVK